MNVDTTVSKQSSQQKCSLLDHGINSHLLKLTKLHSKHAPVEKFEPIHSDTERNTFFQRNAVSVNINSKDCSF